MDTELKKIDFYFEEAKRLWQIDPERVQSKEFYELWEELHKPRPFYIEGNSLTIFNQTFDLAGDCGKRIAYFTWDPEEESVTLVVETDSLKDKLLLTFDDGDPKVYETETKYFEKDSLEYGERLEIIYDVIAYVKEHLNKSVLELTKTEFVSILETFEGRYETFAINVMKRLSAAFIKSLIKKAADDMAADELSNQLSLPLDGHYATSFDQENLSSQTKKQHFTINKCTRWSINYELSLLKMALQYASEAEKDFVLDLSQAEIMSRPEGDDWSLKASADPEMPIEEGDILNVYIKGIMFKVGTLKIDIFDGNTVYARLRHDHAPEDDGINIKMVAKLTRSPSLYKAQAIEQLCRNFEKGAIPKECVLNSVTGVFETDYTSFVSDKAPEQMDMTQKRAWSTALYDKNPVVLIQGPPGTGKTSVLENILRRACKMRKRILITAPSNTAVDNICRRVLDLPVLRFGYKKDSISPDVRQACWIQEDRSIYYFSEKRKKNGGGGIYAGTHLGLVRDDLIQSDIEQNGLFDIILFDEAGMTHFDEFLLCGSMAKRAIIIGDHQQLPPFPMPKNVTSRLKSEFGAIPAKSWSIINDSSLEWLVNTREFPIIMLQQSYRCQNPRLLRFCSTLFYDANVKTSDKAEYYQLSYLERQKKYPPSTMTLYSTSQLPSEKRFEKLSFEGQKPGLENPCEAAISVSIFYQLLEKYPLQEITIISPYKRQTKLIRNMLSLEDASKHSPDPISEKQWQLFLFGRISTVDSFQGGESDVTIISYVRSNNNTGIGFVDDPNRINVSHTRCRKEMIVVADIECLKSQARNKIFHRMERAIKRDGIIQPVNETELNQLTTVN